MRKYHTDIFDKLNQRESLNWDSYCAKLKTKLFYAYKCDCTKFTKVGILILTKYMNGPKPHLENGHQQLKYNDDDTLLITIALND